MVIGTRQKAYGLYRKALREGRLVRSSCCERCGDEGVMDGHHKDYKNPLDVEWLCHSCHGEEHGWWQSRGPGSIIHELDAEEQDAIIDRYYKGENVADLANSIERPVTRIYQLLRDRRLEKRLGGIPS